MVSKEKGNLVGGEGTAKRKFYFIDIWKLVQPYNNAKSNPNRKGSEASFSLFWVTRLEYE